MTRLNGIVLAAGAGRRMGGTKALLELQGATLVEHHVARLAEVGCTSIVVVVPPEAAEAVRALLVGQRAARAEAAITRSQAESLAVGLRALGATGITTPNDVLIITPVDLLPAQPATFQTLLACLDGETLAVTPECDGRGGHPVIARRALLTPYDAQQPSTPPSLRDVLTEAGKSRRRVRVDDPRVLGDFDTPSDLLAFGAEAPG
jgi:molybdenum cofactor cytidylyltransferase